MEHSDIREKHTLVRSRERDQAWDRSMMWLIAALVPTALLMLFWWLHVRNAALISATLPPPSVPAGVTPRVPLRLGVKSPSPLVRDAQGQPHRIASGSGTAQGLRVDVFMPMRRGVCTAYSRQFAVLKELDARYRSRGVTMALIADIPPSQIQPRREKYAIPVPLYSDADGSAAKAFGVMESDMVLFVTDTSGCIAFRQIPPFPSTTGPLIRFLDEATSPATSGANRKAVAL